MDKIFGKSKPGIIPSISEEAGAPDLKRGPRTVRTVVSTAHNDRIDICKSAFIIKMCNENSILFLPANPSNRVTSPSSASLHTRAGTLESATMRKSNNPKGRIPANLKGRRFGKLTVVGYAGCSKWNCKCECGKFTTTATSNLNNGHSKSCGCLVAEASRGRTTHGHTVNYKRTPEYVCWTEMLRRCTKPAREDYRLYGGRGIKVCQRWTFSFLDFVKDMGNKPPQKTLGRINNDGDYKPSNCEWQDAFKQGRNKRNNHFVKVGDESKTVSEWARQMGADPDVIFVRIRRGWDVVKAVTFPLRRRS